MFRRSPPAPAAPTAADAPPRDLGGELDAAGWLLPRAARAGVEPAWTLVGTVALPVATAVDPAGLVVGSGWSLDWWVGADDRWHLPSREAGVRRQLVADAPVVETLLRIPGGDAVHRAYGFRAPRPTGDEWVAVEVENRTPVPFALALVVRPFVADGVGAVREITVEPVDGGRGRDDAHLVRVDGTPALVLPRRPARFAAGNRADGDVVEVVTRGEAGSEPVVASCPDGLATLALILPLPHTAVLRVVVPVGPVDDGPLAFPSAVPDAATVAAGWDLHRSGPRVVLPDARLGTAFERSRAQVLLADDGTVVRRDGAGSPPLEPGATEVILGALDALDRPADVGAVVAPWASELAAPSPGLDVTTLTTVARHGLWHGDHVLLDWMLPQVAAAVERLERAERRGQLTERALRRRAVDALVATALVLGRAGQPDAARAVGALGERIGAGGPVLAPSVGSAGAGGSDAGGQDAVDALVDVAGRLARGEPDAHAALLSVLATASDTGAFTGPGPRGRRLGHDLAAAAAVVLAVRALLVHESADEVVLAPGWPRAWYGGGMEVHDLPTAHGVLSYALRWHGTRPALLWELEPRAGSPAPVLRIPALDPNWSSTEVRGDALLAEVEPPAGLDPLRIVADHPDIDPAMRRPGAAPEPSTGPTVADGGSFS